MCKPALRLFTLSSYSPPSYKDEYLHNDKTTSYKDEYSHNDKTTSYKLTSFTTFSFILQL